MDTSKLKLTEVLYLPKIGFTLISISRIDDAGYIATFGGGKCLISNGSRNVVGSISKTNGLYHTVHDVPVDSVNATSKRIIMIKLHC